MDDVVIVGSGPASLAVALALITAGIRPKVLCTGLRPENSAVEYQNEMRLRVRGYDVAKTSEVNKEVNFGGRQGLGNKNWFGSNSASEQVQPLVAYSTDTGGRISYGLGGFSKVWGATSREYDFSEWDPRTRPSQVDFVAIQRILPSITIGGEDGFVKLSPSSQKIFEKLKAISSEDLFKLEQSTVAINREVCILRESKPCGHCLQGCPEDAIFSSDSLIMDLSRRNLITLHTNILVESIEEVHDGVEIAASVLNGGALTYFTQRLILAAGALGTPTLLVKSEYFPKLTVRDSATLFSVGIDPRLRGSTKEDFSHGLSQWWLNRDREEIRRAESVFVQGYSPSTQHTEKILSKMRLPLFLKDVIDPVTRALHPLIVYFDMNRSGSLEIEKHLDQVDIRVRNEPDHEFIKSSMKQLRHFLKKAGLIVPISLSQLGSVGEGFHSGASLPMLDTCDENGLVKKLKYTYVVDSSCLPRIEAGPITKTVMINAHRIGRLLGEKIRSETA